MADGLSEKLQAALRRPGNILMIVIIAWQQLTPLKTSNTWLMTLLCPSFGTFHQRWHINEDSWNLHVKDVPI